MQLPLVDMNNVIPLGEVWQLLPLRVFSLLMYRVCRMTFTIDPDTHIDALQQGEAQIMEGTSKWSAKIAITGTSSNHDDKRTRESAQRTISLCAPLSSS